ncbi:tetraacyldisaccharide 4'-kinase [Candidatus Acidulodesulfobacterium sp. H_13]|uniref:tetraacyldisaccharide 4'-kinase n=1 Tax=Candidatus Acidulodesulfobacterium sp. H_13 TaxID=3395470 RepID=UPI003AF99DFE
MRIPVIISKNRLSAAKVCSDNDDIYYNLAEDTRTSFDSLSDDDNTKIEAKTDIEDMNISGKCMYKDVYGEYEKHKKVAIIDDGFSALNIKKNLNIVLIDNTVDIFRQNVIPAGILREPLSVLKHADVIVVNKCDEGILKKPFSIDKKIRKYNASCPLFYSRYKPTGIFNDYKNTGENINLKGLKNRKIITVCAIGNPDYFYDNLMGCGALIGHKLEFEDHCDYSKKDMESIKDLFDNHKDYLIITTLKDYVKLKRFNERKSYEYMFDKIYYLDFELAIDKSFFEFIYNNYRGYSEKK